MYRSEIRSRIVGNEYVAWTSSDEDTDIATRYYATVRRRTSTGALAIYADGGNERKTEKIKN